MNSAKRLTVLALLLAGAAAVAAALTAAEDQPPAKAPAAGTPAERPPLYKAEPGPYRVAAKGDLVLHDARREKDLHVRVTWPADGDGPFPLIVWSHGAFGSKDGYGPLVTWWAGHGYVCLQATHSDSLSLGRKSRREAFADWASRPKDVAFMLDSLGEIARRVPELKGRIDADRIGVGGHSFGAHTAQLVAGATTTGPLGVRRTSHADPRPKAFLLISPQGRGELLDEHSWEKVTRPMMVITGTKDDSTRVDKPWTWRTEPYRLSPPGGKYLLVIEGAWHGFGGIAGPVRFPSSGPDNAEQVAWVRTTALAFWDAYLKDDPKALAYLRTEQIEPASGGQAQLEIRDPGKPGSASK